MAVLAARLVGNQDDIGVADFLTLTRNFHHHPFDLHNRLHHLEFNVEYKHLHCSDTMVYPLLLNLGQE